MKRVGNLFEQVLARDNLRLAFHKASRGKRDRAEVREFAEHLEARLGEMSDGLRQGSFALGRFSQFIIHDPKERIITAPCFAERVLHHALTNVCEPVLDRWLIADTFACRVGRGRLAALDRAQQFARRWPFFLKLDIRKYFDSIPHEPLLERLERKFKDGRLLALWRRVVGSYRGAAGRGVPIGSLTSQHLANFYLGWFDRFVKEKLQVPGYVRYMDDMALWCGSVPQLTTVLNASRACLREELKLELKEVPYINRTEHGMDFLGCRVYRQRVTLNRRSRVRFRRKLHRLEQQFLSGRIDGSRLQHDATALVAFTRTPGLSSWRWRRAVLEKLPVSG